MKKTTLLISMACIVIAITIAGCAPKEAPSASEQAGGYTEDREVTAEDLAVFEAVIESQDGVGYKPTLVATQVVAGTNYRFTATATSIVPDAEAYEVYVYIFEPLSGEPELTEIVKAKAE